MKRTVYIIKDANGDEDSTFVVDGDLDASQVIKLVTRLSKVGYYLDAHTSKGNGSQLVQRIATIEKLCEDDSCGQNI